jgi:hypothetical protein
LVPDRTLMPRTALVVPMCGCSCQHGRMVGPPQALSVDTLDGPRWELALELLEKRDGIVDLRGLLLYTDPPTEKGGDSAFTSSSTAPLTHRRLEGRHTNI